MFIEKHNLDYSEIWPEILKELKVDLFNQIFAQAYFAEKIIFNKEKNLL